MRKYSEQHIAHLLRRSRREPARRYLRWIAQVVRREMQAEGYYQPKKVVLPRNPIKGRLSVTKVVLEGDLHLLTATASTLKRLRRLDAAARIAKNEDNLVVKVDLTGVTSFDAPSVLYLCSRIDQIGRRAIVIGTWPESEKALKSLLDANFSDFLRKIPTPPHVRGRKSLQVHAGSTRALRKTAAIAVQSFLTELHPDLDIDERDNIYTSVFESLENIRLHAYGRSRGASWRWYVVGQHDEATCTSTIAILDVGIGIRRSVQQKSGFIGRAVENRLRPTSEILKEATSGLRTETGRPNRGQGLKNMRNFTRRHPARAMHVLSGDGMVTWTTRGCDESHIDDVSGTIVCLELRHAPSGDDDAHQAPRIG